MLRCLASAQKSPITTAPETWTTMRQLQEPLGPGDVAASGSSYVCSMMIQWWGAPGMILEGVVTNVAAFGAFVDIGVHQDGLVHVSAMAKTFVKDPRAIVKPGDIVRVKVLDVDRPRKRIALTLRLDDEVGRNPGGAGAVAARADNGSRNPPPSRKEPTLGGVTWPCNSRAICTGGLSGN